MSTNNEDVFAGSDADFYTETRGLVESSNGDQEEQQPDQGVEQLSQEELTQEENIARATGWDPQKSKYSAREHNARTPLYNRIANQNKEKAKLAKQVEELKEKDSLSAEEIRTMKRLLEATAAHNKKAEEEAYARAKAEFEAAKYQAVADGDLDRFKELEKQEKQDVVEQPKIIEDFNAKYAHIFNGTRTQDIKAAKSMVDTFKILMARKMPIEEAVATVENNLKADFPEYFQSEQEDNSVNQAVETNTSSSYFKDPNQGKVKGFSDIPEKERAIIENLCKVNGLDKEKYAKSYWACATGEEINVFDD